MTLSAPKVLLFGPPGSGKTFSIWGLLAAGLDVRCVFTEAGGHESVLDACELHKVDTSKLHWTYISQAKIGWDSFLNVSRIANTQTFEMIANMKMGIEKEKTNNIMELLNTFKNYKCQRTGKEFGDVYHWAQDCVLWVDTLSGLNDLIMQNTWGLKPNPSPGEWNIAMSLEANLIKALCGNTKCWLVMVAHVDKVLSEVTSSPVISPAAIGAKLGPKIGKDFSEVIYAKRVGSTFLWSTSEQNVDVKNRALPISDRIAPDFRPLVEAFRRREKAAAPAVEVAVPNVVSLPKQSTT